jgi:hypothetical protein
VPPHYNKERRAIARLSLFVSATGGTFDSDIPGTFESDTGGTFNPLLSAYYKSTAVI